MHIINESGNVTSDLTEIKRIREYCEHLHDNK